MRRHFLIVVRGPPGAGKSTLSKALAKRLPGKCIVLHKDFFGIDMMHKLPRKGEFSATALVIYLAGFFLDHGFSVVLDGIFGGPEGIHKINEIKRIARKKHAKFVLIFLDMTLKNCLKRNRRRKKQIPERHVLKWYSYLYNSPAERGLIIDNNHLTQKEALKILLQELQL